MAAVSGLPDQTGGGEKESRSESDSQGGQSEAEDRKERNHTNTNADAGFSNDSKELAKAAKNSHISKKKCNKKARHR